MQGQRVLQGIRAWDSSGESAVAPFHSAFVTCSFILYVRSCLDISSHIWSFGYCSSLAGTDYSYYHAVLEAAFQFLSPLQQNLLKFCLSLRSYSATIQAFQQVRQCLRVACFLGVCNVIGSIVLQNCSFSA